MEPELPISLHPALHHCYPACGWCRTAGTAGGRARAEAGNREALLLQADSGFGCSRRRCPAAESRRDRLRHGTAAPRERNRLRQSTLQRGDPAAGLSAGNDQPPQVHQWQAPAQRSALGPHPIAAVCKCPSAFEPLQRLMACSISPSSRAMLRTIASVLSRGQGRRGICIGSTLPRLPTIGGDADIALQQQAGFLFVVGPGERTDLTAPDGPAGQAQAQPRAINSQGSNRPRQG